MRFWLRALRRRGAADLRRRQLDRAVGAYPGVGPQVGELVVAAVGHAHVAALQVDVEKVPAHRPHERHRGRVAVHAHVHRRHAQLLVGLGDLVRYATDVEKVDAALKQRKGGCLGLDIGGGRRRRRLLSNRLVATARIRLGCRRRRRHELRGLRGDGRDCRRRGLRLGRERRVRGVVRHSRGRRNGHLFVGDRRDGLRVFKDDGRDFRLRRQRRAARRSRAPAALRLLPRERGELGGEFGGRLAPRALAGFRRVAGEACGRS